jgi:aspartyl-tRNA(Asn)/glutamyl-tRNA(Gln) amidotransferase subunit A
VDGPAPYHLTRQRLDSGATTCVRMTEEYLHRIQEKQRLNAFLTVFPDQALAQARAVDRKLAAGKAGPLAGMIVALKDALSLRGERLSCASRILKEFSAVYTATAVERLIEADAVVVGKTNMDEFAMGSSSENSAFGPVLNPVDETRVAGGSSGGSCVAVAAGLSHTALGSDTGGSIRQPAAFCGVVGLKPTYGRVSRYGLVAMASSFDQIGPFAVDVRDTASVLQVIAGHDPRDATSLAAPVPDYLAALDEPLEGVVIGVPREAFTEGLGAEVREAIERTLGDLRARGARTREITLPHAEFVISTYYILMTAEASSNLARYDGARYGYRSPGGGGLLENYVRSRSEGFGPEVKRRIMLGTYVLSAGYYDAYYRKAQQVRRLIQEDFRQAFGTVDCILMPTTPTTAFALGEKIEDPLQMYLSDIYTVSANLAGIPAISVPCGTDVAGLPIGAQLLGRHLDESTVLRVAHALEQS